MIFESSFSITPGASITARLDSSTNRLTVEVIGTPGPNALAAAIPKVLQLLANKSRLPVHSNGVIHWPEAVAIVDATAWGEGSPETISSGVVLQDEQKPRTI